MNIPQVSNSNITIDTSRVAREVRPRPAPAPAQVRTVGQASTDNAAPESATPAASKTTAEQVREAVKEINRSLQQSNRALEFSVDEESERLVVRLKDGETGEVIRQFPSEETLAISRYIADIQQGLLLNQKA